MPPKLLPDNIIASLGRSLQGIYKDQFSESFLNRILRLMLDNLDTENSFGRIWPPDTVVCTYGLHLFSHPHKKDFLEFQNMLFKKFKGKEYLILLEILPAESPEKTHELSNDPEMLLKLLESFVFVIKNGVQILKIDKALDHNKDTSISASDNLIIKLITDIASTINPYIFIVADGKLFKENRCMIDEINKGNL